MSTLPTIQSTSQYMKSLKHRPPPNDPSRFCAFIVTITNYKHINPIPEAVTTDAIDVEEILTNKFLGQFPAENVMRLTNPSKKQFTKKLKTFQKRCRSVKKTTKGRCTILVYMAGHTGKVKGGRRKGDYLLMSECKPTTNKRLTQGAVKIKDFMKSIMKLSPKNCLFIMHMNHGTELLQGIKGIQILLDSDGTQFAHLTEKDKLTVKGIQNDIDHDILSQ